MHTYDLVIVGSGAGLMVLEVALAHGLRCALIEKDDLGGTCLNRGCIPSKVLVYPADLIRETEHAQKIGLSFPRPSLDWDRISQRMWSYIGHHATIEKSLSALEGVTLYRGTGSFIDAHTMQVTDERSGRTEPFRGERFVLAAGARTAVPPIPGLEESGYVTAESFFGPAFPQKPWERLVIIGGGAIGLEFAHIFSAFGTQVSLVEREPRLAPLEEPAVSALLERVLKQQGLDVLTGQEAVRVQQGSGGKQVLVRDRKTGQEKALACDQVLIASGVQSNADLLNAQAAGLALDEHNYVITNAFLETNQPHVFTIGDLNGKFQFRHKANYEAEILAHNLFSHGLAKRAADYRSVPWAIFTSPQVAHVGLREDEVRALGKPYQVALNEFSSIAKGYAMGYEEGDIDNGFVKIIVDEQMKILGAHVAGPHAAVLVQPFVYLMNAGLRCTQATAQAIRQRQKKARALPALFPPCSEAGTFEPIIHSMVIHPSLSEVTAWALESLEWASADQPL